VTKLGFLFPSLICPVLSSQNYTTFLHTSVHETSTDQYTRLKSHTMSQFYSGFSYDRRSSLSRYHAWVCAMAPAMNAAEFFPPPPASGPSFAWVKYGQTVTVPGGATPGLGTAKKVLLTNGGVGVGPSCLHGLVMAFKFQATNPWTTPRLHRKCNILTE